MGKLFGIIKWFWNHKKISLVLIIIIGALYWWFFVKNGNDEFEESSVMRGEVEEELILSGTVVADEHAKLAFATGGTISYVGVTEGDEVVKGKLLAKIDTIGLNSTLQRARADLRAQEANVAEVLDDVKGNDEDETFEEKNTRTAAEVAKDKAYEAVLIAEDNLRKASLYAPFKGIVTYVANPFSGVNVLATQTQIEVINPETIHFEVAADQTEVTDIKLNDRVSILLDSNGEKELAGVVTYISYSTKAGEIGAVYEVKIEFDDFTNGNFTYRVGMTGDAHFVLKRKNDVLYAPSNYVKSDKEGDYVLVNGGKDKTYVEIGLEGEERTEILSGLEEGALIYDD